MKRNLFLGAVTMFLLLSCGEDRDDDKAQQNTILQQIPGTWTITKKESNGVNVPSSTPCQNLGSFIFGTDMKLAENHRSVVNSNCVTDTDNYTYSVDENNKQITAKNTQNEIQTYVVSSLSSNELVLINTEGTDITKYIFTK